MHVSYRAATMADVHGVAMAHLATHRETWRGLVENRYLNVAPLAEHAATWSARLSDPMIDVAVAECGGEIIGAVAGGTVNGEGVILDILVMRPMQCRGIGSRLMGQIARDLRARGHTEASLWTRKRNVTAIVFFRAIGGSIVDATSCSSGYGLPALKLRWETLDDLAFWDSEISLSHHEQTLPARGGRSPSAVARTAGLDAAPPASDLLPRD